MLLSGGQVHATWPPNLGSASSTRSIRQIEARLQNDLPFTRKHVFGGTLKSALNPQACVTRQHRGIHCELLFRVHGKCFEVQYFTEIFSIVGNKECGCANLCQNRVFSKMIDGHARNRNGRVAR